MSTLRALALAALAAASACFLNTLGGPPERSIHGTLVRVEHDERYEAPCSITQRVRDRALCDVPPVCCAYRATVRDSLGHSTSFWFFAPRGNRIPQEGWVATWRLTRQQVWRLSGCSPYGCPFDIDFVLQADSDISP